MARQPRLQRLTVFLLKAGVARGDAFREGPIESFRVPVVDKDEDALFVKATPPRPPWWVNFLSPHAATGSLDSLFNSSTAAVLLVATHNRLFALAFGQGRHLLEPEACEQDFGLKVVLNTVAPDQLKSVDTMTIDELTLHTRRGSSRDATLAAFGLDVTRDLVRAVTGTPRDETLARRVTGADALALNTRAQVPDLAAFCARLLEAYQATEYRENFDFVDHLRTEREHVPELEEALIQSLRTRAIDDVHLAAPEPVDWLDIDGFRFSTQPETHELDPDPRISEYLDSRDGNDVLDVQSLRRDRVMPIRTSDGSPITSWSVYRCLVYEVQLDDHLYVLSAGEWYRVSLAFKDRVYEYISSLPSPSVNLPTADAGTDEAGYNVKAAAAIGGLCLDQNLVYDEGPDKMEICDILTRGGALIHVKHRGSSSTLSHLFSQGVNCAERLLQDQEFRTKARAVAAKADAAFASTLPDARPSPDDHEIIFAVITRSERATPLTLPFFSLVSLRVATMRLQTLGFPVSAAAVREERMDS
jgi:uncharacterized protein (TIGR04141 family)